MTCAKQTVTCTIILPLVGGGKVKQRGTNGCRNPQAVCPRAPGEGYEKCKSVCDQEGHAEQVAISRFPKSLNLTGATAYISGHTYACDDCKKALAARGITNIVIQNHRAAH